VKPITPDNPEHAAIFEVLQTKCRLYAERMGKWPSLVYLPIEMHEVLQKGILDEYGQPNKLLREIKLFELEDVDRPAESDYILETVIWDGPALVGINMSSPTYATNLPDRTLPLPPFE
jgi:hypothetical protein